MFLDLFASRAGAELSQWLTRAAEFMPAIERISNGGIFTEAVKRRELTKHLSFDIWCPQESIKNQEYRI